MEQHAYHFRLFVCAHAVEKVKDGGRIGLNVPILQVLSQLVSCRTTNLA